MPQPVADTSNVSPRRTWAEPPRVVTQPDGSLADHQQLAFDGGDGFGVGPEGFEVHAASERFNRINAVNDVPQR